MIEIDEIIVFDPFLDCVGLQRKGVVTVMLDHVLKYR
jgi:hypothetical protein